MDNKILKHRNKDLEIGAEIGAVEETCQSPKNNKKDPSALKQH